MFQIACGPALFVLELTDNSHHRQKLKVLTLELALFNFLEIDASSVVLYVDPNTLNLDPDQNFGPIWIRIQVQIQIQGYVINLERRKKKLSFKNNFFKTFRK